MEEISRKHYDKIAKKLELTDDELKAAIKEILRLNPRPGNSQSESAKSTQHIIPDFILTNNEGVLELQLNSRNAPDLKISKAYQEMLVHYSKSQKNSSKEQRDAVVFVKQKIDSARWFIDAIKQRQQTLMLTMQTILEYQYEYFSTADETKLRPMILKDIAEKVFMDISTISRVANSKYIQTSFGTFLLKSFFSESLSTDTGEEVSTREVKKILEECVAAEDKHNPVTDDKLAQVLREKGYNIARRTVAKYREQLNIPVARMRKEL
jgi:RNA polymerase sigma-54 factor